MIGELNIDGVFVPSLLVAGVIAFCLTSAVRFTLRRLHAYRFVWHAGLFDVALFVVLLWVTAAATATWNTAGVN
jgi:protein AaeX